MATALFWQTQQINALTNLHDEDVKALIEMDQFYQKKLKYKGHRKTKPCQVIYVA
jgi:endonuclease III